MLRHFVFLVGCALAVLAVGASTSVSARSQRPTRFCYVATPLLTTTNLRMANHTWPVGMLLGLDTVAVPLDMTWTTPTVTVCFSLATPPVRRGAP